MRKYNTGIHPRDYEISSTVIFTEIVNGMNIAIKDLKQVKESFYTYFRQDYLLFSDVEQTVKTLFEKGIQFPFTSNDTGYRKSCAKGLEILSEKMQINIADIVFVGDEQKDIICATNAGIYAVLINRESIIKNYGQDNPYFDRIVRIISYSYK